MPSMYDYDVLIESYPSLLENPETGRWYEVAPEGSRCSEGSAWHGLVRLGADAGKAFLQEESCHLHAFFAFIQCCFNVDHNGICLI